MTIIEEVAQARFEPFLSHHVQQPFDMLAERLNSKESRDKTAIELFLTGIRGWEAALRRRMDDGKSHRG